MDEYVEEGEVGFRTKWSRDGKLMASIPIIKRLRNQKREDCKLLIEMARQDSGNFFDDLFSYQKCGTRMVMKDPVAMARRNKRLYNS